MPEVRLIDANAFLFDVLPECKYPDALKAAVERQPTIEPEVRHGRWIRRETVLDTECKCSVCGYKDFVPKHDNYWFKRKFCPNCGALMDATDTNVGGKGGNG